MSDFDNYFGYRDAMKYGDLVPQETDSDQPINTIKGTDNLMIDALRAASVGTADASAGILRGLGEGFVGLPGDLISLSRALYNMGVAGAGESKLDAFLEGLDFATGLPTTEDISDALDRFIGPIVPPGASDDPEIQTLRESAAGAGQLTGEILAPAGYLKLARKGIKAVAKKLDGIN